MGRDSTLAALSKARKKLLSDLDAVLTEIEPKNRMRRLEDLRVSIGEKPLGINVACLTVEQWVEHRKVGRTPNKSDAPILRALREGRWYPETKGMSVGPWAVREIRDMRAVLDKLILELGSTKTAELCEVASASDLHALRLMGSAARLGNAVSILKVGGVVEW